MSPQGRESEQSHHKIESFAISQLIAGGMGLWPPSSHLVDIIARMRNSSGLNDSKDKLPVPTCFSCFCPVRLLKSVRGSLSYKLGMFAAYSTN